MSNHILLAEKQKHYIFSGSQINVYNLYLRPENEIKC